MIIGSTGLVGNELLTILLEKKVYDLVISVSREPLHTEDPRLKQYVIHFDEMRDLKMAEEVEDVFCCLGTTRKKAGSKEAFYKVDYQYVLDAANASLHHKAQYFYLVSSMGASSSSNVNYYQVKGEIESSIADLPFKGVHIFRPSLLLGDRTERRIGEGLAKSLFNLLGPMLPENTRAIDAREVAMAMFKVAQEKKEGVQMYKSGSIRHLANR